MASPNKPAAAGQKDDAKSTSASKASGARSGDSATKSAPRKKTTRSGQTKTVSKARADETGRKQRATRVAETTQRRKSQRKTDEKGLADLLEHALKDMYYAEKKIYRSLPKMIRAADDEALASALSAHRDETQGQIETLETVFEAMGLRAKGERCDAIDGILSEAEGILEDFGGTLAGDAAIIFSARAVEHYEIARYTAMVGFADAMGMDEVRDHLQSILDQETGADGKLESMAEGSINEAACEYDEADPA